MLVEVLVAIICILVSIVVYLVVFKRKTSQTVIDEPPLVDEEYKLVMCVRNDLKMTKGKIAAQCGHAVLGCVLKSQQVCPKALKRYIDTLQVKVALKVDSLEQLNELHALAKEMNLVNELICDAGRTQIEPGSVTVLGIGPAPTSVINKITGKLKLL
ncbi:peptidyl-tRNA hydrolase [Entamoeba marina]